jgi:hypothetical protein
MTAAGLLVGFSLALALLGRELLAGWRSMRAGRILSSLRGIVWVLAIELAVLVCIRLVEYLR